MSAVIAAILSASAIGLPDLGALFNTSDYPASQYSRAESFAGTLEVTLDEKGAVVRCTSEILIGSPQPTNSLCAMIAGRRVTPARTQKGAPAYFWTKTITRFVYPNTPGSHQVEELKPQPDLIVPSGILGRKGTNELVNLAVVVDPEGKVVDCTGSSFDPSQDKALVKEACDHAGEVSVRKLAARDGTFVTHVELIRMQLIPLPEPSAQDSFNPPAVPPPAV